MTRFYFVRHGQTMFNEKQIAQGHCDSPLTKLGIEQAKNTREQLAKINFDICFSSSPERCFDTAQIVLDGKCEIVRTKNLREFYFGELEGDAKHRLWENKISDNLVRVAVEQGWKDQGGETYQDLWRRVDKQLKEIAIQYPDSNVLIVGHWGTVLTTCTMIKENLYEDILEGRVEAPKNGQISIIELKNDNYELVAYNKKNL